MIILVSLFLNEAIVACDPVIITGPSVVCPNVTNTFTVTGIPPSQINFWSIGIVPGSPPPVIVCGFTNSPPQTVSLCLEEGFALLCVSYGNGCEECKEVSVTNEPLDLIIGETLVCGGDIETYTLSPPAVGISINYTVTNGTIISSNNSQVVVQWEDGQTSGQICANATFCNNSQTICTSVDIITIPTGTPPNLFACGDGTLGQAIFNLTNSNPAIGGGLQVNWFEDIGLTVPITNPTNYQSGTSVIYAVVTNGTCFSAPVSVTIDVFPTNPLFFGMEILEDFLCASSGNEFLPITIFLALPTTGVYVYEYELVCENGTTTDVITTSNNPIILSVNSSCTLRILSIISVSTGCQIVFSQALTDNFIYTSEQQVSALPGFENVCLGESIDLNDFLAYSGGNVTWYSSFPPDPANILPSSVIMPTISNTYGVSVEFQGCVYNVAFPVNVTPVSAPFNLIESICVNAGNTNLNQFITPPNLPGSWSGQGVIDSTFNPTGLSGDVTIIFNPINPCYQNGSVIFQLNVPQIITLIDTLICESADSFDLNSLLDTLTLSGVWSGQGVTGNIFFPSNLSGNINISFTPSTSCITFDTTIINVIPSIIPLIGNEQICETVAFIDLTTLQDSAYPTGSWSGDGVIGNIFYTAGLSGGITLSFTAENACAISVQSTVIINNQQIPILQTSSICQSASPLNLLSLVDPVYPTGYWSGVSVTNNFFNPEGLVGNTSLTFISDQDCTLPADIQIIVYDSPQMTNLLIDCQNDKTSYTVSFDISGGDSTSYIINGVAYDTNFVIATFATNTPYSFILTDSNKCATDTLQGLKDCTCSADPGTMSFDNTPLKNCSTDSIRAIFNNDSTFDFDDVLRFVLHDNPGLQLGNILAISNRPTFAFPQNGILGTTYYISPIVTDTLGNGDINVNNPCFSIARGVPIIFYEPLVTLLSINDFCITNCADIAINIIGEFPFNINFEVLNDNNVIFNDALNTVNQNNFITLCPENFTTNTNENLTLKIINASDKNCSTLSNPEINFNLNPVRKNLINTEICEGKTLIINGITYDESNTQGQQIIPSGQLNVCDSIIDIDLKILLSTSANIDNQICKDQSIMINGNIYDQNRLSGTEIVPNKAGCDSVITIDLQLVPFITLNINQQLCTGESLIINGNRYDVNNPNGQETITSNATGICDSIITIDLQFIPESLQKITQTICDEETIEINGVVFGSNYTNASFTFTNAASNGCDSTLVIEIKMYPKIIDTIRLTLTKDESRVINGIIFNENNPSGLTQSNILSINGCFMYEYIIMSFGQEVITTIFSTQDQSCPNINDGSITITSILGCKNYKVQIDGKTFLIVTFPFIIRDLSPETYNLEIFGENDCYYNSTVVINASSSKGFELLNNVFEKNSSNNTVIDVAVTPTPKDINWTQNSILSCDDCLSPIVYDIDEDTKLQLLLTDSFGCIFAKEIFITLLIEDTEIIFPNIFSPNGDGNNDTFVIYDTPSQKLDDINIFDRWGNLVFTKKNINLISDPLSWDGNLHSQSAMPGVYVYLANIILQKGKRKVVKGDFVLIK